MPTKLSRKTVFFKSYPLALILMGAALVGCDSSKATKFLTIGTAPGGGAFAQVGDAIANTLDANAGELSWQVNSQETKGTQENIRKLEAGDLEFGMANAAIAYFAAKGEGAWEKPHDVRVVATMAPNVGVFVALQGSGLTKVSDLKGKRVVLGPAGAGFDYFLKPLLAAHGISYDDLEVINGNYNQATELLGDGQADAAFMGGAIPIGAVTNLCASKDVVFLKFDDDAPAKLQQQHPFYFTVPIPAEKYSDLNEDMMGINVGNMIFATHANVDEDIVYNLTKLLYEHQEQVAEKHPAGKALNKNNIVRDTGTEFHPGAIKFYKEAGIWPESN